jgi:flagellar assembly factor FliW
LTLDFDGLPILDFVRPIAGFPDHRRFVLTRVEGSPVLFVLRAVDPPEVRFLVVVPAPFFPDYTPEIDEETLELLDVHEAARLLVLLVVSVGASAADATVNLLAPIIVDQISRRAVQTVLADTAFGLHAPLARV